MRLLSGFNRDAFLSSPAVLVAVLLVCTALKTLGAPRYHSLLVHAVSWGVVWLYSLCTRPNGGADLVGRLRKRCWAAGASMVLAHVCDRTAGGREQIWWTHVSLHLST